MLESRYIPSKQITRVQAASQGQQKTEDGIRAQRRDGTLLLLQSLGAVTMSHRGATSASGSCEAAQFAEEPSPWLRGPSTWTIVGAGAASDHLCFIGELREKRTLLWEHVGSTGSRNNLPEHIRNFNCWCLVRNCIWDPSFYTFGRVKVQPGTWDLW